MFCCDITLSWWCSGLLNDLDRCCKGATPITTCDKKHKFATTVTNLHLQTHLCNLRRIIVCTVTHACLQSHIGVYSHIFASTDTCSGTCYFLRLYIYIGVPQRRNGSFLVSFVEDSELLSRDSFPLPLPFTSSPSPFPFPSWPLQHQQGLAALVA
jgi:hypothetical protein